VIFVEGTMEILVLFEGGFEHFFFLFFIKTVTLL